MMNKKLLLLISLLALGMSFSANANKPIYKWKDGQGNIKYTQSKPPHGIDYEVIYQRISNNSQDPQRSSNTSSSNASPEDDILAKQQSELERVKKANQEIRVKNCKIASNNLDTLQNRSSVYAHVDGERRLLSAEERKEKLALAQNNVDKYCQ